MFADCCSCFKYMAMYSFTEFTTVLILYWLTSNYGDLQYLYIDLLTITVLALVMGRSVDCWWMSLTLQNRTLPVHCKGAATRQV